MLSISYNQFMLIIIGLGNPGEKFQKTHHNIGFMVVDFFAKENNFPEFKFFKKYNALISENNDILLVKPQTFMNESGKSVIKIISNFLNQQGFPMVAFQISNLIVVHDDVDLPLGKLKISKDSGAGGHKGVESIINNLKTQDFIRFRIGIGKQRAISGKKVLRARKIKAEKIVLKKITDEDWKITKQAVAKTSDAIILFSKEGLEKTMNKYN